MGKFFRSNKTFIVKIVIVRSSKLRNNVSNRFEMTVCLITLMVYVVAHEKYSNTCIIETFNEYICV